MGMFTATDTADPCDSLPPAIPAGGGRSRVRRPKRTAVNRQSDSEREEEQATWAALLIRIRDHRDEAAFAAPL